MIPILYTRPNPSTIIMPTHNNMRNLQRRNSILQGAHNVEVRTRNHVRDVAEDEDVAGVEAHYFVRGDAGVRAAYPEVFGLVDGTEGVEVVRVDGFFGVDPFLVVGEDLVD